MRYQEVLRRRDFLWELGTQSRSKGSSNRALSSQPSRHRQMASRQAAGILCHPHTVLSAEKPQEAEGAAPLAPGEARSRRSSGEERAAVRLRGVERSLRLSAGAAEGTTQCLEECF